jgi:hypothetical protein
VEIIGEAARFASSRDQYKAEASPTRQLANEQLTKPAQKNTILTYSSREEKISPQRLRAHGGILKNFKKEPLHYM